MGLDTLALTNGNACIEAAGLDQHISTLYCADDLGVMKPHPDSFKRAFEQHGVAHNEVIHIGDNLVDDIQGARSAGVASIWVNLLGHPLPTDLLDVRLIDQHRPSVGCPVMVTDLLQIPTVVTWMKDRL
jgi:FMN phosphatase YigB (HAD superfamily)